MSTELQFSSIKDELTSICDGIIKKFLEGKTYNQKKLKDGPMLSLMKSSKHFTLNKEDLNSFATEQFSKKEMHHFITVRPACGTQILMDQSLLNTKMNKCIVSLSCSELLHKECIE